jgi:hypothetical protein
MKDFQSKSGRFFEIAAVNARSGLTTAHTVRVVHLKNGWGSLWKPEFTANHF